MDEYIYESDTMDIRIDMLDWHRGTIPIIRGEIIFRYDDICKRHLVEPELLEYIFGDMGVSKFATSYTEFLYKGSPDYGYHLHIEYFDEDDIDASDISYYYELDPDEDKEKIITIRNSVIKAINDINKRIYSAEKIIYDYIKELEEEGLYEIE